MFLVGFALGLSVFPQGDFARWQVDSHVSMPYVMWVLDDRLREGRVTEVQLNMQLFCGPEVDDRVSCSVESAQVRGAAMPGDEETVEAAMVWSARRLTGSTVTLSRKKGRLVDVDLALDTGADLRTWRRTRARDENLRLLVSRAMVGFDLPLRADEEQWGSKAAFAGQLPVGNGTSVSGRWYHEQRSMDSGKEVISAGKVQISIQPIQPGSGESIAQSYIADMRAIATFSAEANLQSRRWTIQANPTAGSGNENAVIARPYVATGTLTRVIEPIAAPFEPSGLVPPTRPQPTALQQDFVFGIPPISMPR